MQYQGSTLHFRRLCTEASTGLPQYLPQAKLLITLRQLTLPFWAKRDFPATVGFGDCHDGRLDHGNAHHQSRDRRERHDYCGRKVLRAEDEEAEGSIIKECHE